jgi:hypothetical protein
MEQSSLRGFILLSLEDEELAHYKISDLRSVVKGPKNCEHTQLDFSGHRIIVEVPMKYVIQKLKQAIEEKW